MYCLYLAATYQVRKFLCYGRHGGRGVDIGKQLLISARSSVFFVPLLLCFLIHSTLHGKQGKWLSPF